MPSGFSLAKTPHLQFGEGSISSLSPHILKFGHHILLVTGNRSFMTSPSGERLIGSLRDARITANIHPIGGEPTPVMIDEVVSSYRSSPPDCVVAIGGGSVIDAGKAISAMILLDDGVKNYVEGVGNKAHPGSKVPFIAVPTTSGTGSEATKNAVIAEVGQAGYKRSLRHDNFVPDVALIDPRLVLSCPPDTTASSGMDAFTQLLESYLSTASNPVTDSLARHGLRCVAHSLQKAYDDGEDIDARADMALAAYLSGVTLANAGLGLVHGLASPIGGFFGIPHGIICSALMASVNNFTVKKLRDEGSNPRALSKYAEAGKTFSPLTGRTDDYYIDFFLDKIQSMTLEMKIPSLSHYGLTIKDLEKIADSSDCKNNPVRVTRDEMIHVMQGAL